MLSLEMQVPLGLLSLGWQHLPHQPSSPSTPDVTWGAWCYCNLFLYLLSERPLSLLYYGEHTQRTLKKEWKEKERNVVSAVL